MKIERYRENRTCAERQSKSPLMDEFPPNETPSVISIMAPPAPIATPRTFSHVIGSFKKTAASSIVKIGVVVVMIEAFTGEVYDRPMIKLP